MGSGRPTIFVVPNEGDNLLITPIIDLNMAKITAQVDQIAAWNDGAGSDWREDLPAFSKGPVQLDWNPTICHR